MPVLVSQVVGNENIKVEVPEKNLTFTEVIKKSSLETGPMYDLMSAGKKACELCNASYLQSQCGGYVVGSAVANFLRTATSCSSACEMIAKDPKKLKEPKHFFKLSHDLLDFGAGFCYLNAFFRKNFKPWLKLATPVALGADSCEAVSLSLQIKESNQRLNHVELTNPVLKREIHKELRYSCLKVVKTISAIVAGILTCAFLFGGVAPIPMGAVVAISLASALLNLTAYYYKNYCIQNTLKIEPARVTA